MTSLTGTEVVTGQMLAGKYRIDRVLGRGGMGVVVQATHVHLDERVALKFLLPEALANAEAVKRFEREARAAVKIKSEHVARVIDVGTLETGSPYMVMEYLSGVDLAQYLDRGGVLGVSEAVDYVVQAMEAIAEAHALGIVHRDLKPANLFRIVRSDGTPSIKVLDFGISKIGSDHSMTQTSSMMGSPYYMSPEQMVSSKSVDARTDIWSLGVILYELLAGHVPFDGEAIPEIVAKVLQHPVPPIETRVDIPAGLERVLAKALAKERDQRYSDVAALAAALAPFASADTRASVQRVSRVLGVTPEATLPDGAAQSTIDPEKLTSASVTTFGGAASTKLDLPAGLPKRSRGALSVGLGAALLGLAGAAVFALTASPTPRAPEEELVIAPATTAPGTAMPSEAPATLPETRSADRAPAPGEAALPLKSPAEPEKDLNAPGVDPDATSTTKTPETKGPRPTHGIATPQSPSPPPAATKSPPKEPTPSAPAATPRPAATKPSDLFSDRK